MGCCGGDGGMDGLSINLVKPWACDSSDDHILTKNKIYFYRREMFGYQAMV